MKKRSSIAGNRHRMLGVVAMATAALTAAAVGGMTAAQADTQGVTDLPSAVPASFTPGVNNGQVLSMAQVGNTMVVGGKFASVSAAGTTATIGRTNLFAFNASTGAITSFAPQLNGDVEAIAPGPTTNTVYIGGGFTKLNGATANRIALVDLTTGSAVGGFNTGTGFNQTVSSIELANGHLFVGGQFAKYQKYKHVGIATLNPTTGANDPYWNLDLAGTHNQGNGRAERTGVRDFDISPDGSTMAVVGNFRQIGSTLDTQLGVVTLGASSPTVRTDFHTNGFEPACYSDAFDADVRKVGFDPTGRWFAVTATGGGSGTLCDSVTRWDLSESGQDIQPTWQSSAGGDTTYGLAVTSTAVFVGGHMRWMNNSLGNDYAGAGAVARPGLAALDPNTGIPVSWNPGRNPRGAGAYTLLATSAGVWVGSDTPWIGNHKYKRPRLAFFPYTGGYDLPSTSLPALTGLRVGGQLTPGKTNVLYRIDTGGPTIAATDGGPAWVSDISDASPYRNSGSSTASYADGARLSASVPSTTPSAIFNSERWDPAGGDEMSWRFSVPASDPIKVRLYFANRYSGTGTVGGRVFDVDVNGSAFLTNYDIVADAGDQTGTMKEKDLASTDGTVTVDFGHVVENPLINGIEIIDPTLPVVPPTGNDTVTQTAFDGTTFGSTTVVGGGGIAWSRTGGAFVVGGWLYYVDESDHLLHKRTITQAGYGADVALNPYHDPAWMNVNNGSGGTYNGNDPTLVAEMPNLTGLFFDDNRIYYTVSGDPRLHFRSISLDSGIVSPSEGTASSSFDFSTARGMTYSNGNVYYVDSGGKLWSLPFSGGSTSGTSTLLDDPATSGRSWTGSSLFVAPNP